MNNLKKHKKHKVCNSVTYTTGDPKYNMDQFNARASANFSSPDSANTPDLSTGYMAGGSEETGDGAGGLSEAKRYVRRYYIRPFNIFCSNKNEILKALIDNNYQNCTVYTLNNLGDIKDVHRLTNKDIIYYFDEGILYDKNHIRIMDYDLAIKHEENRKKYAGEPNMNDSHVKDEYEDRMTEVTELEENINPFELDFPNLKEDLEDEYHICCICGEEFTGYGNNPEPYMSAENGEVCCDACNLKFVIPARIEQLKFNKNTEDNN